MNDYNAASPSKWTPERVASVVKIILAIAAVGIILGVFASEANLYYVGVMAVAAALFTLVAWKFEVALVIYVLVAFVPWGQTPDLAVGGSGVGKGLYVSEIMLGFLLAIWWTKYLFSALPKDRLRTGFHIPILLYIGYSIINVIHSFIFWDPNVDKIYQYPHVNLIEVGLRILSAGAFIMMATSISDRKWLKWTTLFIMVPGLYNLFNSLAGSPIPVEVPWWPLVVLLPVGYLWAVALDKSKRGFIRVLAAAVVTIAVYSILVRGIQWVSGWLALTVALAVVTFLSNKRLFAVAGVAAVIAVAMSWSFFNHNVILASAEEGDYDRFSLLSGALKYATTFPLGVGLGNYRTYNSFHYGDKWGTTSYTSAHGTYAQHLSEMGIPGLLLLGAILAGGFRWMLKEYRRMPQSMSRTYMLAAMGQMAGIVCAAWIGDYIIPTYHNGGIVTFSATVYSWLIWGLAVAHARITQADERKNTDGSVGFDCKLEHARSPR